MATLHNSILSRRTFFVSAAALVAPVMLPAAGIARSGTLAQSPWSKATHSDIRLLAGGPVANQSGSYLAGIELRMNPGFKTYWRNPGDSGVPPVFHFDGSENLKSAEVRFPAPMRFADGAGGFSFGYGGPDLILPLEIVAQDPAKPVLLKLHIEYAVCEKLCVPASGKAVLALAAGSPAGMHPGLLLAQKRVPILLPLGEGADIKVTGLRKADQPEHFLVDVAAPNNVTPELFIEGETPWFLESKSFSPGNAGAGTFLVAVIERSKAVDCTGADLTLTLKAYKNAIEVRTRLDLALVSP